MSDNLEFLRITSEFSLSEWTSVCASEIRISSSSMYPDDENGTLLETKHDETNKWEDWSHVQQWLVEGEYMHSLMREDEVLRSDRSGWLSFEENTREDGKLSECWAATQKITRIIIIEGSNV